jgi:hypothetical protein
MNAHDYDTGLKDGYKKGLRRRYCHDWTKLFVLCLLADFGARCLWALAHLI